MKGDIVIVEEHHRSAARTIVDRLESDIRAASRPYTITVAGESGSGKSETGTAIADECANRGLEACVFQQDDYFRLPPKSNDRTRLDTLESRKKRGREPIEPFLERVLEIEHRIIAPHREKADVIISADYEVSFVDR
ncbi:MAG: zeta toxin family protein [Spirochaetota bacterium]